MKNKSKDKMLKSITKFLEEQANSIMSSESMPIDDKVPQMDIILNVTKFLADYDKNIEILNKYYYDNRYKQYHTEKGEEENDTQQH